MDPEAICLCVALTEHTPSCHNKEAASSAAPFIKLGASAQELTPDLLMPSSHPWSSTRRSVCIQGRFIKYLLATLLRFMDPTDLGLVRFYPLIWLYLWNKWLLNHKPWGSEAAEPWLISPDSFRWGNILTFIFQSSRIFAALSAHWGRRCSVVDHFMAIVHKACSTMFRGNYILLRHSLFITLHRAFCLILLHFRRLKWPKQHCADELHFWWVFSPQQLGFIAAVTQQAATQCFFLSRKAKVWHDCVCACNECIIKICRFSNPPCWCTWFFRTTPPIDVFLFFYFSYLWPLGKGSSMSRSLHYHTHIQAPDPFCQ